MSYLTLVYLTEWSKTFRLAHVSLIACRYPVLVAVDEWNVKFEESKSCPELLDRFALQKLVSIYFLVIRQ